MRALVSGGFGLIGSFLTPLLVEQGYDVGVIARRVPASFEALARQVDVHRHDLREGGGVRLGRQYDVFIHLAGSPHSDRPGDPPGASLAATRSALDICRAHGIARFVHFSSFQVYGRDDGRIDEATPLDPVNDYGKGHVAAEELVRQAGRDGILGHAILRPTNTYGFTEHPEVHRWSLVPGCFCKSAAEEGEIVLRTSGLQQKDFIHLGEVARLTSAICRAFDRFRGETVNLASGCTRTIIDVARQVQAAYEEIARRPCGIRVLSNEPQSLAPLVVSRAKTVGLSHDAAPTLATEIAKTLTYLTQ